MEPHDRSWAFVPDGFEVPRELVTAEFRLEPLGPQHNVGDYEAWTSSIDHIRATPGFQGIGIAPGFGGSTWPDPGMTLDENLADLRRHAEDFAQRTGFTYTVLARGSSRIIGCVYIYPSGRADGSAIVRSWVRADRPDLDVAVHDAVSAWLNTAWPFTAVSYAPRTGSRADTAQITPNETGGGTQNNPPGH